MKRFINRMIVLGFVLGTIGGALFLSSSVAYAAVGVNPQLSFAGKVVNTNGTNPTDGTYNMEFKIYQGGTSTGGGVLKWTEDRLVSGNGVPLTSGTYTINLGSVNPFGASVDWNQDTLWLSMQIGNTTSCSITTTFQANCAGDGEMSPYIRLTAVSQALNSNLLNGLSSTVFGQLTNNQTWTGANTIKTASSTALQVQNASSNSVLTVDTSLNLVSLGKASTLNGSLVFNNSTNANAVTLQSGISTASYALTLPTATPTTNQCLQAGSSTATQLTFGNCNVVVGTLQNSYNGGSTINTSAAGTIAIAAAAAPTATIMTISNAGQPVTTAGANGLGVNFTGGSAAVEASGVRIDYAPGSTSGGVWSGIRVVANATGAATGVNSYGIKLEGPSSSAGGTNKAVYVGTGWDIGMDIQSGGLQLANQADPAAPAAGNLKVYAKDIAGRATPNWLGPTGASTAFQAGLGFNRVSWITPLGGTTLATIVGGVGTSFTNTGTVATPILDPTNMLTSGRRVTFSSGLVVGGVASHRQNAMQVWRGNAPRMGGFFYTTRFGVDTLVLANRAFVGLSDSAAAPANVDPTTSTASGNIGMAINANTGNWNFVNNVSGTAPTVTGLGANFPVNNTDVFELDLFSAPNGSSIGWRVIDLSTNAVASGSVTTNLFTNTTFIAPQFWITNNVTVAAAIMDFEGWYLESDD